MAHKIGVGLLGVGNVGGGVARLLTEGRDRLIERRGLDLEVRKALVRDLSRLRRVSLPGGALTTDPSAVVDAPDIQVVAEQMGGSSRPGRSSCAPCGTARTWSRRTRRCSRSAGTNCSAPRRRGARS